MQVVLENMQRFQQVVLLALYLALNSRDSKIMEDAFRMRVREQKMILEQLETMSNKYLNESQKKKILGDMKDPMLLLTKYLRMQLLVLRKGMSWRSSAWKYKPALQPASIDNITRQSMTLEPNGLNSHKEKT